MTKLPPPVDHVLPDVQPDEADAAEVKPRRWLVVLIVAAVAGALLLAIWIARGRNDAVRYVTAPVTRGDLRVTVTATGTLEPTNQVQVGTEISGRVDRVLVDYNDAVKVGQILARIDTSRLEAQVQQSRAAVAAAEAKVLQSEATRQETAAQLQRLTRMRELTDNTIPSASDLDTAKASLARAEADLASSRALVLQNRATLDAQQTDLAKAVIRSPVDGVVLQRSVEPGQTVAASLQAPVLFVLAENLKQMELHVDVDEADVSAVKAGQEATFTVDAFPDRQFTAQVSQVHYGAATVSGVVTYETVLVVDNSSLELRPGMTATANITVKQVHDVLRVPNASLRYAPATARTTTPAATSGGLMSRLMPRMPARGQVQRSPVTNGMHRVWVLKAGSPVGVDVRTGATDGVDTQILSGDLKVDMPVIVDSNATAP